MTRVQGTNDYINAAFLDVSVDIFSFLLVTGDSFFVMIKET